MAAQRRADKERTEDEADYEADQASASAFDRPRGDCHEDRHLSCKTFLANLLSPRFG